jgi:DNA-3-methyladenine glycosylase
MATRSWTGARSSERPRGHRLGRAFFDRPAPRVARELLGTQLEVHGARETRTARIVEVEAYLRGDPASHAFRGATRRNRSMFLAPGTLYVFRIHQVVCANLVTRRREAVLLRAGTVAGAAPGAGRGPGRLCRALGIRIEDDGTDAVEGSRVSVRSGTGPTGAVATGPRVGLRRATERRLRYWIAGDPDVSRGRSASGGAASPTRSPGGGRYRRTRTRSRPASGGGRRAGRSAGR